MKPRLRTALGLTCAIVLVAALVPLVGSVLQATGATTPTLSDTSADNDWGLGAVAIAPQPAVVLTLCSTLALLAFGAASQDRALRELPRTRGPPAR